YNVLINLKGMAGDPATADYVAQTRAQADEYMAQARELAAKLQEVLRRGLAW
ncbi:hypothetical protein IIA79_06150, partial [bacterium]|nr:hypothetical protein [bacterium]